MARIDCLDISGKHGLGRQQPWQHLTQVSLICRWLGRIALILGTVNFYVGVHIHFDGDQTTNGSHLYIAASVILGNFLLLAILKDALDYLRQPQSRSLPSAECMATAGYTSYTHEASRAPTTDAQKADDDGHHVA